MIHESTYKARRFDKFSAIYSENQFLITGFSLITVAAKMLLIGNNP
ncbi:hypothetical protein MYAER_1159 [Microcystis aeruginosa NIES-2549]|uniref:Uncharacterized protein n=1 Tax=Microcystis aeruginosa NIES-2549 TaxID=1641812 RepID=A0A0F6U2T5_MICAE|nr:hypothetical protein MYAER_1159 [Microcystis aeruginosa NIES-2549]